MVLFTGYHSVYVKKLSDLGNDAKRQFNSVTFSQNLWTRDMPKKIDSAVGIVAFIGAMNEDKTAALKKYTNSLDIGNYRYALVKTDALVSEVHEDDVSILITAGDSTITGTLATEFIYGNEIRDASGLINIKKFVNISDLNSISAQLDKIVRSTVIPPFKKRVKKGDRLAIVAAIQINQQHLDWDNLKLIPVRIKIIE